MKKTLIAALLVLSVTAASALDVGVSMVRDAQLDKTGARVTLTSHEFGAVAPQVTITNVNDVYIRYGVGAEYSLVKVGGLDVALTGAGVFQDATSSVTGYGLTTGLKATYPLTKNIGAYATLERFYGQERISAFNGNTAGIGLVAKF